MPELVKLGHIFIAQPPLYKIKRKKREEYIDNDDQMSKILVELARKTRGCTDEGQEGIQRQQLISCSNRSRTREARGHHRTARHQVEDYLGARNEKTSELPVYAMRIKEDGATRFEFACNDKEWSKLCDKFDINLDEEVVPEIKNGEKPKGPQVKPFELNESNSIQAAIETLEKKGSVSSTTLRKKIRFLNWWKARQWMAKLPSSRQARARRRRKIQSQGQSQVEEKRTPIHSIPDILERVKENGKRGLLIQRYKGLEK